MTAHLRIVDDPVASLHSLHADADLVGQALASVDAVIGVLPTGAPRVGPTFREDAADELVDAIHEHVRDGSHAVEMRVEGLSREEWDEMDGVHITGWSKRREFRENGGGLVAAIVYETDEGWDRR